MQIAICHYSFNKRWKKENWTAHRLAQEVKALGVEGIDFHTGLIGPADQACDLINSAVSKYGLTLASLSMSNDFNQEDAQQMRQQVDSVRQWIAVAAELNVPVSRIFGGHIERQDRFDDDVKASGRQRILDGLGQVVSEAEKYGVVLALENHGGLPCLAAEQVEVIEQINSPYLKATVDVGNYLVGGQEGQVGTAIAAKHAAYVHFKDYKKVPDNSLPWGWTIGHCNVGDGEIDLPACVKALDQAGYHGFAALEFEGQDEENGISRSIEYMKKILS